MTPPSTDYGRGPEYFEAQTGPVFDEAAATAAATSATIPPTAIDQRGPATSPIHPTRGDPSGVVPAKCHGKRQP